MLRKDELVKLVDDYIKENGEDALVKPLKEYIETAKIQALQAGKNVFFKHFVKYVSDQLQDPHKLQNYLDEFYKSQTLLVFRQKSGAGDLDQIPQDVRRHELLSLLDKRAVPNLGRTSSTLYHETKTPEVWIKKLIELGIDPELVREVQASPVTDYQHLYHAVSRFVRTGSDETAGGCRYNTHLPKYPSEAWQLLCLSGEKAAVEFALAQNEGIQNRWLKEICYSGNAEAIKTAFELTENKDDAFWVTMIESTLLSGIPSAIKCVFELAENTEKDIRHVIKPYYQMLLVGLSSSIPASQFLLSTLQAAVSPLVSPLIGSISLAIGAIATGDLKTMQFAFKLYKEAYGSHYPDIAAAIFKNKLIELHHEMLYQSIRGGDVKVFSELLKIILTYLFSDSPDATKPKEIAEMGAVAEEMKQKIFGELSSDGSYLALAASIGSVSMMDFLIANGATPSAETVRGAARSGDISTITRVFQLCDEQRFDFANPAFNALEVLKEAVKSGNPPAVRYIRSEFERRNIPLNLEALLNDESLNLRDLPRIIQALGLGAGPIIAPERR